QVETFEESEVLRSSKAIELTIPQHLLFRSGHSDRMSPRRKLLLVFTAGVLLPRWAAAQRSTIFRVGWISLDRPGDSSFLDHFRTGLRDLGYVEGRNLMIDARWGEGSR